MQQLNTLHSPATATTTSHRATKHAPPPPSREEREEVERLLIREWALWAWICRVIGGEDEEDVMERSSAGLCGLLKDGERLCRLIVTLRPSVVSPATAHLPPILQHRARLRHFLNACTSFGIPPHHQFTVDELYYDHNLPKLLACLEHLEKKAAAEGCRVRSPSADQVLRQQLVQWGIKQRIPFLGPAHRLRASKILAKWPQTRKASMSGGSSLGLPLFSSFAGSVSEERTAAAIKIQSVFRSWHAQRVYNAKLRNARHREKIARELYDTEKEYAQNLQILIQVYLKKMHTWAENAPMSGMKALYGDIKVIHGYTEQVLAQLRPRVYAWGPHQVLGDIFLQLGFFLKVYTQYVTNYSKATRELAERKKKSTRFAQFLDAPWSVDPAALLFRDKIGSLGIQSFLIQPVQRVPRYLLLLNALLKRTDPDHKDYNNIQKAAQQVSQVADYIEKRARESENIAKVIEIQNRLHPKLQIVQPNRKFVRSCRMSVEICQAWGVPTPATQGGGAGRVPPYAYPSTTTAASDGKKSPRRRQQGLPKNYEVFLCSDLLLVAKPKDPHNPDTPLKLRAAYDITQLHPSADMSDHLRFALVSEKGQTVARFTAASATDRHSWLTDLAKLKITREMSRKHRAELLKRARGSGSVIFLSSSSRSVGSGIQTNSSDSTSLLAAAGGGCGATSNSLSAAHFRTATEAISVDTSASSSLLPAVADVGHAAAAVLEEGEWKSSYDPILAAVLGKIYADADRLESLIAAAGQGAAAAAATTAAADRKECVGDGDGRSQARRDSVLTIRPALHKLLSLHEMRGGGGLGERQRSATWDGNPDAVMRKKTKKKITGGTSKKSSSEKKKKTTTGKEATTTRRKVMMLLQRTSHDEGIDGVFLKAAEDQGTNKGEYY